MDAREHAGPAAPPRPTEGGGAGRSRGSALRRRLAPLYAAVALQGVVLWVPIEKLFLTGIGFDAASIGLMAAVYSVAVPLFELPSGVLADRWSRRGVLLLGTAALIINAVIGGLSQNVPTYLVAALFLGIYFAMVSGTLDSVVYDTVFEETGDSAGFERTIGRVRLVESVALVGSALLGAGIAQVAPLPTTYFLTIVPLVGAGIALLRFREPRLHNTGKHESLRQQLRASASVLLQRGRLRAVIALMVAAALLAQAMLEFGPLWLVALGVPALLYGPHWAGLTAALGLGALLGSTTWLTRRWVAVVLACLALACCLALTLGRSAPLVIAAQVLLTVVVIAVSIPATRRLHDGVTSSMRASVASGVGALTWLAFVPFALSVGVLSDRVGVADSGWLMAAVAVVAGALIVTVLPGATSEPVQAAPAELSAAVRPTFPPDRFKPADDPDWPGHWADPPRAWDGIRVERDDTRAELRAAIRVLPAGLREAIVLRDVQGQSPAEVQAALGLDAEQERTLVHQARGLVRAHLERFLEEHP